MEALISMVLTEDKITLGGKLSHVRTVITYIFSTNYSSKFFPQLQIRLTISDNKYLLLVVYY